MRVNSGKANKSPGGRSRGPFAASSNLLLDSNGGDSSEEAIPIPEELSVSQIQLENELHHPGAMFESVNDRPGSAAATATPATTTIKITKSR